MEISAIGLKVHDTACLEEIAITVHEQRRCETLLLTAYLRIRKCDPDLGNLALSEERLNELDACTKESDILKPMLLSIFPDFIIASPKSEI